MDRVTAKPWEPSVRFRVSGAMVSKPKCFSPKVVSLKCSLVNLRVLAVWSTFYIPIELHLSIPSVRIHVVHAG